jgi:hypothetical protein
MVELNHVLGVWRKKEISVPEEKALDLRAIRRLIIAGWTGRDAAAVEKHIRELEAIGVSRPKRTPIFYRGAASLLTTADSIEVLGDASSGEVECVTYALEDGLWVGLGSDHTDRKAETVGVSLSKQMCAKPVSSRIWRYDDVGPHWDRLLLRSFVRAGGVRRLYQEGPVSGMRPPMELIALYTDGGSLPQGSGMFCGTLAVHGGIAAADQFEMELEDPVLRRIIRHSYIIESLPIEG